MAKKIVFPQYLYYGSLIVTILGYMGEEEKYVDNRGYVDRETKNIYVYKPTNEDCPYFVVNNDNEVKAYPSKHESWNKQFNLKNAFENGIETIINSTPKDAQLYDEAALADMNAATSLFIPEINANDDPLKKIIKKAIIEKKVDINRYKSKFPEKYSLTNYKTALISTTKMSIAAFLMWCDLLELDFRFTVMDNGKDIISPLDKPITFSSMEGFENVE